jgi:hypothetical protein
VMTDVRDLAWRWERLALGTSYAEVGGVCGRAGAAAGADGPLHPDRLSPQCPCVE